MPPAPELPAVLKDARNGRFYAGLRCPHCRSIRAQRWGTFSGRQRYRCRGCARTFSDLTGSPAAYLKKAHILPRYARCMAEGLSVRKTAQRLGIDPTTAFRWRHRLCIGLRAHREQPADLVEGVILRIDESFKGSRRPLPRAARKRGARRSGTVRPKVCIVAAVDRRSRLVSGVVPHPNVFVHDLEGLLGSDRKSWTVLAEQGHGGPWARFARRQGSAFCDVRGPGRARALQHARTVHAYVARFGAWLAGFRGVSTRYLENYLAWHRVWDREFRSSFQRVTLHWPLEGPEFLQTQRERPSRC